jgi:hypothetical protein
MLKWIEISEFTFTTIHDNAAMTGKMGRGSLSIKSVQIYPSIANLQ